MAGTQNIINALKGYTSASHNEATNAANREVSAFDPERSLFVQGSGRRAAASPSIHYQRARDVRGEMESTGRVGDLAIDKGQGYFVVKTKTGTTALSNMGSFRIREVDQKIVGPSGEVLMGWKLDAQGKRPATSSSLDSLSELSTKQLAAEAVATDKVNMSANLRQQQKRYDGPGATMSIEVNPVQRATDLIAPGEKSNASFFMGDQIKLTPSGGDGQERIFEFGGSVISRKPGTITQAIYTATGASDRFQVTNPGTNAPDDTWLTFGSGFTITLGAGGGSYTFRADTTSSQASNGLFNSLNTLADAINSRGEGNIRATIADGRLIIAPTNANDILTFTDVGTPAGRTSVVESLGLFNTVAPAAGVERYASLEEFAQKVESVAGLTAEIRNGTKVFFGADDPTASLTVAGESYRPRSFRYAYSTPSTIDSDRRYGIAIDTPSHGLVDGDHIRVTGGLRVNAGGANVTLTDGIYRVTRISDDRFMVFQQNAILTAGGEPLAANANLPVTTVAPENLSWRKVEGNAALLAPASNQASNVSALNDGGVGADHVRVTLDLNAAPSALEDLAANDVIFVQNSTVLEDGYYRVTDLPGANTINVAARAQNGTRDLRNAVNAGDGAVAETDGFTAIKVSGAGGGLDSYPIRIANGTRTVTVTKPGGHGYSNNDIIMFTDIAGPILAGTGGAPANGTPTIRPNTPYTITVVDANTFTFEYSNADPAVVAAGGDVAIGYSNRDTGGGALGANVDQAADAILGLNAQIQNVTKMFKGIGVETTPEFFSAPLAATYDPDSTTKSIHSGRVEDHQTHTVPVFDSFGKTHQINISYLKINDTKWAVEVWQPKQPNGAYDAQGNNSTLGRLAYGNITFDGNGKIANPTDVDDLLRNPIPITWNNGAAQSSITLDFGGEEGKTGVTMLAGEYDIRFMDPNGSEAGALETIEYQSDGTVVARFTNGTSRAFAQLPVAVVPDPNSLIAIGGGHYVESLNRSGAIVLKVAGIGGAGVFLPGFLEGSKADENEALLNMTELNHLRMIALKAVSKEEEVNAAARQWL